MRVGKTTGTDSNPKKIFLSLTGYLIHVVEGVDVATFKKSRGLGSMYAQSVDRLNFEVSSIFDSGLTQTIAVAVILLPANSICISSRFNTLRVRFRYSVYPFPVPNPSRR